MASKALQSAAAAISLAALNLAICWRLFEAEYTDHFSSIEGSFIAIARYLSAHWHDSSWWPLWHCGMPYQDTYVPLLHLTVAATASLGHISAAHAYHSVAAVAYSLGPVALYFMAVQLGAHRGAAFASALFYSLLSPSAFLMPNIARDVGGLWYARRLQVLAAYGEGPHVSAMTLLPLAILALESALTKRTGRAWALAAICIAIVFLTNVPGTMSLALAIFCWICAQSKEKVRAAWIVAASASLMAYGLACYGLPPSSVGTVLSNVGEMHQGFSNSLRHGPFALLLVFALTAGAGYLMTRLRVPLVVRFGALYFALVAAMAITAHIDTYELLPQAGRLHLDMEIGACLLLGSLGWTLYAFIPRWIRPIVLALLLAPIGIQFDHYRTRAEIDTHPVELEKRSEYTSARWLDANLPGRRVYASGSTSFWLNAFSDAPQMAGCCDQGQSMPVLNQVPGFINAAISPHNTEISRTWMQALGVDAIIVNGPASSDAYKDFRDPERFDRIFTPLHRENGDTIYSVLPANASLAHVLHPGEQVPFRPPHAVNFADVQRYAAVVAGDAPPVTLSDQTAPIADAGRQALEGGPPGPRGTPSSRSSESPPPPRPLATFEWLHGNAARIHATLSPSDLLSVQVAWFPGWKAVVQGHRKSVTPDGLGFIIIQPQCQGECDISLQWTGRPDMPFAAAISLLAVAFLTTLIYRDKPLRSLRLAHVIMESHDGGAGGR